MIFSGNMQNANKERCLKASQLSGHKIEIRSPSKHCDSPKNYFGLYRKDFDISKFWNVYQKLKENGK